MLIYVYIRIEPLHPYLYKQTKRRTRLAERRSQETSISHFVCACNLGPPFFICFVLLSPLAFPFVYFLSSPFLLVSFSISFCITPRGEVVIVGAGIAGLATALALKRVGVRALVLEKSPELRATGAAISILSNGWLVLHHLGVAHKLTSTSPPTSKGFVTKVANGAIQEVSYSGVQLIQGKKYEHRIVHRKVLLESLAEELPPGTIRFSSKLISIHTHITHEGFSIATLQLGDGTIIKSKVNMMKTQSLRGSNSHIFLNLCEIERIICTMAKAHDR
ncbi:monooxygenase 3-like [Macadamia integrifolia]|uniref:monooxygenase 3-like n=1 Tax=Macadamia integrifolia TaxID=60698 RepID=UPI001C52D645|nr:monooxygenase 3-like [Macadamia integrifolia]